VELLETSMMHEDWKEWKGMKTQVCVIFIREQKKTDQLEMIL
jgi:hypothetical protein